LGQEYPEIFFLTSTTDDRVHPGHARKMAAKMEDLGHPMLFFEAEQGGHAMAITNKGKAHNYALQLVYLLQKLQSK
jgi:prolyl oligopeptidase